MSVNLPPNWSWVKLGDVCENIIGGGTPSTGIESYWSGKIPWITSADILGIDKIIPRKFINEAAIKESATNLLPKGNIVVVTRVGLGKLAKNNFDLCFSQDSQGLILNKKIINTDFALVILSKAVQSFKIHNRGTTISGVIKKQLQELIIPLPPLPIQQKIVSKIEALFSELDSGVASLKKAKEQIKTYRQSVLASAFSGRLGANLNINDNRRHLINQMPTNKLSDERLNAIQEVTSNNKAAEPQAQYRLNSATADRHDSSDLRINMIKTQNKSGKSDNPVNHGSDNYTSNLPEGRRWVKLGEIISPSKERFEPLKNVNKKYIGLEHIEKETGKIIGYADSNTVRSTKSVFGKGDLLY